MTRTSWALGSASSWCSWSKKGLRARGFSMPMRGLASECMMRSVTTSRLPSGTGGAVRRATGVVVWVVEVWLVVAEAMEVDGVGEDFVVEGFDGCLDLWLLLVLKGLATGARLMVP